MLMALVALISNVSPKVFTKLERLVTCFTLDAMLDDIDTTNLIIRTAVLGYRGRVACIGHILCHRMFPHLVLPVNLAVKSILT